MTKYEHHHLQYRYSLAERDTEKLMQ